jgi:hypothetical protein
MSGHYHRRMNSKTKDPALVADDIDILLVFTGDSSGLCHY